MSFGKSASRTKTDAARFSARFKQELFALNAKRMFAFCLAYTVFQAVMLIFGNSAIFGAEGFVGARASVDPRILGAFNIVAACAGAVFALFFALIVRRHIRSPQTQSFLVHACLIIFTFVQFMLCFLAFDTILSLHNFLVYVLLFGMFPLVPRAQSASVLFVFAALCIGSFLWFYSAETTLATGSLIIVPAVLILSLAASWLNYGSAKKIITVQLKLESQEHELEEAIKAGTLEAREQVRAAEAANLAKTRFLTRVSHEMRTSMNTIAGMVFLARESEDPVSIKTSLDAIEQASQKLNETVANILDTAKIELDYGSDTFDQDSALLNADSAQAPQKVAAVKPPDLSGLNILIVEDLETNRMVLREYLKDTHANIEEAVNGAEAIERFSRSPKNYYSFIFMDLLMPEVNGHDATRVIRKMVRSDATKVPIVAVSANAFKEDIEASLAAGMDDHLAKPVEQAAIFRTLIERLSL